jgi:hypothetical protein
MCANLNRLPFTGGIKAGNFLSHAPALFVHANELYLQLFIN